VKKIVSLSHEAGQTMAEYGVVLAVITVALVGAFGLLAGEIEAAIDAVRKILPGTAEPGD
jgi:Flp pilus assembly pilin Flp